MYICICICIYIYIYIYIFKYLYIYIFYNCYFIYLLSCLSIVYHHDSNAVSGFHQIIITKLRTDCNCRFTPGEHELNHNNVECVQCIAPVYRTSVSHQCIASSDLRGFLISECAGIEYVEGRSICCEGSVVPLKYPYGRCCGLSVYYPPYEICRDGEVVKDDRSFY